MKTITTLALGCLSLALAGIAAAQTTSVTPMAPTTSYQAPLRDNPGVLGNRFSSFSYTWHDIRGRGDAYDIAASANLPMGQGLDLNLGYDYAWTNNNRNPFTLRDYDARFHTLAAGGTFYSPMTAGAQIRPFVSGAVGYQWSRGDFSRLTTYDHTWLWGATAGVELAVGTLALTPHVGYVDTMRSRSIGTWQLGSEAHTWITPQIGGFVDATFFSPRTGGGRDFWTYTGGIRLRF